MLKNACSHNQHFEQEFWSGNNLNDLYIVASSKTGYSMGSMERIYCAGMREYHKIRERNLTENSLMIDSVTRSMQASHKRELSNLENKLAFFASVASLSSYLGLLGAIWSFFDTLSEIKMLEPITLDLISSGVVGVLGTTAIALVVSIPAMLFYNQFLNEIKGIAIGNEAFIAEFSNILLRASK